MNITPDMLYATIQIITGVILTAAVPWVFVIERRLARIEAKLTNGLMEDINRIRSNSDKLADLARDNQTRIIKLEK